MSLTGRFLKMSIYSKYLYSLHFLKMSKRVLMGIDDLPKFYIKVLGI